MNNEQINKEFDILLNKYKKEKKTKRNKKIRR